MSNVPPPPPQRPFRPIQQVVEQRRADVNRINDLSVVVTKVTGTVVVNGVGEAVIDVSFPVRFLQKPTISFGSELDSNQSATQGSFPTANVNVQLWNAVDATENTPGYYAGARLGIVTTGTTGLVMIVHWQVEGKAFKNPVDNAAVLESVI